jgi:hypothetical protein
MESTKAKEFKTVYDYDHTDESLSFSIVVRKSLDTIDNFYEVIFTQEARDVALFLDISHTALISQLLEKTSVDWVEEDEPNILKRCTTLKVKSLLNPRPECLFFDCPPCTRSTFNLMSSK